MEIVKKELGAMKVNEDGFFIIGTYELRITQKAFDDIYENYMEKIFSRSF